MESGYRVKVDILDTALRAGGVVIELLNTIDLEVQGHKLGSLGQYIGDRVKAIITNPTLGRGMCQGEGELGFTLQLNSSAAVKWGHPARRSPF